MKNINAGDLRHSVTLNRNTGTASSLVNQAVISYTAVGTFYAKVECVGGAEAPNGDQLKGVLKYKVTLRASAGPIYPSDQLVWNGHNLNVATAVFDPFGIFIVVEATEKGQQ